MTLPFPTQAVSRTSIDDLIGLLYDATTDVAKWRDLLMVLARHFGAFASDFIYYDFDDNRFTMHLRHGLDHISADLAERFRILVPEDPRMRAIQRRFGLRPTAATVHCRMRVTDEELRASRIYSEALHPAGVEYVLSSHVTYGTRMMILGLMRGPAGPVFTDRDCAELHRIVPHLQRAVLIHHRLSELDFAARTSLDALDKVPTGIVVVDAVLRLQAVNAAARRLLDRQDGLLLRGRKLVVENRRVHLELKDAVLAAIDGAREMRVLPGRSFSIARGGADSPLSIRLGTLWGNYLKLGLAPLAQPLAILFVTDHAEPLRPSAEALRAFFGLTEAEAELAASLAAGRRLKDAARDLGRSLETCRSQLKSAFTKTDTSRQADLIRLILSSPSWIDP